MKRLSWRKVLLICGVVFVVAVLVSVAGFSQARPAVDAVLLSEGAYTPISEGASTPLPVLTCDPGSTNCGTFCCSIGTQCCGNGCWSPHGGAVCCSGHHICPSYTPVCCGGTCCYSKQRCIQDKCVD
jgi:hypothetical protein